MVQLEQQQRANDIQLHGSFNSIMVQLELVYQPRYRYRCRFFQFHYGSIRTRPRPALRPPYNLSIPLWLN